MTEYLQGSFDLIKPSICVLTELRLSYEMDSNPNMSNFDLSLARACTSLVFNDKRAPYNDSSVSLLIFHQEFALCVYVCYDKCKIDQVNIRLLM